MKYRRLKLDRRGDISSPIIVILVTVAALAVAGMAIAWMASTGSRASSQGSLVVVGTPTVTAGTSSTLYITLKNLGNAVVNVASIKLANSTATINQNITAGASLALTPSLTGSTFSSGNTYQGTVISDAGTIQFSALCQ
jgi:hypothetical protein